MLSCHHSVFCSGRILAVYKKDIIYDICQMPEFTQHVMGLHIVGGHHVIW